MGVPTTKLVYDFLRKRDGIVTGAENRIPVVDIISYLNEFQEIWFNNSVKEAERNQEASNELRPFLKPKVALELKKVDDNTLLAKYPIDFHTRLSAISNICGIDCCVNTDKMVNLRILPLDKLHKARKNPFQRSDYQFERLLAHTATDGLYIYHDNKINVKEVVIDYYRKPNELHAPSLEDCDGKHYYNYKGEIITEDTEFEGGIYSDNFISDGASILAAADKKEIASFDLAIKRFLQSRDLYSIRD